MVTIVIIVGGRSVFGGGGRGGGEGGNVVLFDLPNHHSFKCLTIVQCFLLTHVIFFNSKNNALIIHHLL